MADSTTRNAKRARTDDGQGGGSSGGTADQDVKLSSGLSSLLGNQKYVKESALTRAMLLAYLKDRGEITEVQLVKVSVQEMGGRTFGVTLEGAASKVKDLKAAVADQEGFVRWSQPQQTGQVF